MADVTPDGPYAERLEALELLIANCPAFRTWTSTASVALARARIWWGETPETPTLPCAVIGCPSWSPYAAGTNVPGYRSSVGVMFIAEIAEAYRPAGQEKNAAIAFANAFGQVAQEMATLQGSADGYLCLQRVEWDEPWRLPPKDRKTDRDVYVVTGVEASA